MSDYLKVCEHAARAAGELLRQRQGAIRAREKGPRDLVTEADLASQRLIREILFRSFPDYGFVGEEDDGMDQQRDRAFVWVVDPLDGTANYVHRLQNFAVSIGLVHHGEIIHGTIFDPVGNEMFQADRSQGAFCNGQRLYASRCRAVSEAMAVVSFSAGVQPDSPEIARFLRVVGRCQGVRRLGSAALNLCYLAAGKLDAYWATSVQPWDVAAGVLIASEAGAVITAIDGSRFQWDDPRLLATSTSQLHDELLALLSG